MTAIVISLIMIVALVSWVITRYCDFIEVQKSIFEDIIGAAGTGKQFPDNETAKTYMLDKSVVLDLFKPINKLSLLGEEKYFDLIRYKYEK